ncbi:hypothetical protein L596_013466 [Steinernema carpocapsae]|uniref:Serpin domain-containing protein n=1 Tax=Steinernema carpocapsae TaxID=34508 RepID=A0A4U5P087_STECR|nr:hypothetical protein L596_013466 [Steinernema carpocapsae]
MQAPLISESRKVDAKARGYETTHFQYLDVCIGSEQQNRLFILLPSKKKSCAFLFETGSLSFSQIYENAHPHDYVKLRVSKFKIKATFNLKPFLKTNGIQDAFTPTAEFSGITDEKLQIDAFGHKLRTT